MANFGCAKSVECEHHPEAEKGDARMKMAERT